MGSGPLCEGCALQKSGSGFTEVEVGSAYERTKLLLIGEASGEAEARESLPFRPYAQSGSLLSDALREVSVSRAEVAITNIVRCRPPKDWLTGAPYEFNAISNCTKNYLYSVIDQLKPRAILALGGTAMRALTVSPKGKYGTLDYIRGYITQGEGPAAGIPVIGTYHPAFIRRGAAHLTPLLQRDLRRSFLLATSRLLRGQHWGNPEDFKLRYQTAPTIDEAWEWAEGVDPDLPLAFDIETPLSTRSDEDERTSFTDRDIKLFQATQRRGEGIALPFRDEYVGVIRHILATAKCKTGFNNWSFDDPVLGSNQIDVGPTDDAMVMFGFLWSDLPKNLQAAAQMAGFPFPWKHLSETDLAFYGCGDVDATLCVYDYCRKQMEEQGNWDSYKRYFAQVWPILRDMSRRGIPISNEKRLELKALIEREDLRVTAAIQAVVPPEVRSNKQKKGLKRKPKSTEGMVEIEVTIEEPEKCCCLKKERGSCVVCAGSGIIASGTVVRRWAMPTDFNPNSSLQVKRLIKFLRHPVPKHSKRTDESGEAAETTEMKELERLFQKTKHPVYPLLIEKRMLTKVDGTYVEGWSPSHDNAVHTTFTFQTATWQTSCCAGWTPITTKRGVVPIRDVHAGDYVWTHRSRWRKVTERWLYPPQEMYEVHFDNGNVLTCTMLHRLLMSEDGTQKSLVDGAEYQGGLGTLPRSPVLQQTRDCENAQHDGAYYRMDYAEQDASRRASCVESVALLEVESRAQKSHVREGGKESPQLEGTDGRWARIFDVAQGRQAPICASAHVRESVRTGQYSAEICDSPYRRKSEEQPDGESCASYKRGSSKDSCDYGLQHPGVRITKIVPVGSFPVHDITVDEDESYESCGVFSHNSRSPNVQNGLKHGKTEFQKELARGFNAMQKAVAGKVLINLDFKSFHALTTAHDFNIPDYARLARIDIHSFVTGYFLKTEDRERWWALADDEMLARFKELKKNETFKFTRDFKAKRAILGIQFGMGYRKLFQLNRDDFESEGEARSVWEMVYHLFPALRGAQESVRQKAAEDKRLVNKFGAIRHLFDVTRWSRKEQKWVPGDQAEQAVAFLPASHAFGHVRAALLAIRAQGWDEKYGLCNQIHDSLVFHCPIELAEECIRNCRGEMERPSSVLVYPEMAPGGLVVGADAAMGPSLAEMKEVK